MRLEGVEDRPRWRPVILGGPLVEALLRFGCIAADKTIRPHVRCNETTRRTSKGKDEIYWLSVADGLEVADVGFNGC